MCLGGTFVSILLSYVKALKRIMSTSLQIYTRWPCLSSLFIVWSSTRLIALVELLRSTELEVHGLTFLINLKEVSQLALQHTTTWCFDSLCLLPFSGSIRSFISARTSKSQILESYYGKVFLQS